MSNIAMLLAMVVFLAAPTAAQAGLVSSFGQGGVALLDPPLPPHVEVQEDTEAQPAPDGSTYLLASVRGCNARYCSQYLFRFRPGGSPDLSFGGRGFVKLDAPSRGQYSLGVDRRSRPVLARSLSTPKIEGTQVFPFTEAGHLDHGFDGDGITFLPKLTSYRVQIQAARGGDILLSGEEEGRGEAAKVELDELRGNGSPVRSFGGDGFVAVRAPGSFPLSPVPAPRGAILIATGECCGEAVSVIRVSARGRLDRRFDRTAERSLAPLEKVGGGSFESEPRLTDANARQGGGVELFGVTGQHGFGVRLSSRGDPAGAFGRRGIHLYDQPVDAALPLRDGGILAFSQGLFGPLRPYLLRPDGTRDPRLRAVALAPYTSLITPIAIGSDTVDVTYGRREEESSSEPPFVARLRLPAGEAFR